MTRLKDMCWMVLSNGEDVHGFYLYALASSALRYQHINCHKALVIDNDLIAIDSGFVHVAKIALDGDVRDSELLEILQHYAATLLDLGAVVCWMGGEDSSWNPGILDPKRTYGNIFAGSTELSGLLIQKGAPGYDYLGEQSLEVLWSAVLRSGFPENIGE
jgi:hypothetical protein